MVPLHPNNIVEPFNHKRKGEANEYKVSIYPGRVLTTATKMVAALCVVVTSSPISSIFLYIIQAAKPVYLL